MRPRLRTKLPAALLAISAMLCVGGLAAQKPPAKISVDLRRPEARVAIARGASLFRDRCEICHFSGSEAQKLGPGLKGIYTRGKFASGKTVTDALVGNWILKGSAIMPAYNKILKPGEINDLIAYIKTL